MNLTLYTTHCPMCNVLTKKLDNTGLQYKICENEQEMLSLGLTSVPILKIDNDMLSFRQACDWIDNYIKENK